MFQAAFHPWLVTVVVFVPFAVTVELVGIAFLSGVTGAINPRVPTVHF